MSTKTASVGEYISNIEESRKEHMVKLRAAIVDNIPAGFSEIINYGMPSYVVPHNLYASGYHCDPKLPLPFVSFASQKNFIAVYHMGIYANPLLLDWFIKEYSKHCTR